MKKRKNNGKKRKLRKNERSSEGGENGESDERESDNIMKRWEQLTCVYCQLRLSRMCRISWRMPVALVALWDALRLHTRCMRRVPFVRVALRLPLRLCNVQHKWTQTQTKRRRRKTTDRCSAHGAANCAFAKKQITTNRAANETLFEFEQSNKLKFLTTDEAT